MIKDDKLQILSKKKHDLIRELDKVEELINNRVQELLNNKNNKKNKKNKK